MNERVKEKLAGLITLGSDEPTPAIWIHAGETAYYAGHALVTWWLMWPRPTPLSLPIKETSTFYQALRKLIESDDDLSTVFEIDGDVIRFREETGLSPEHEEIKDLKKYWRPKFNLPRLDLRSGKRPTKQEKSLWLANMSQDNKQD